MKQLPQYTPGANPYLSGTGTIICHARRDEIVTISLYSPYAAEVPPGFALDAMGLGLVCRIVPRVDLSGSDCSEEDEERVRGTDHQGYTVDSPTGANPQELSPPFYLVDLPRIFVPFEADLWLCGGVAFPPYDATPFSVAYLKRWASRHDRRTNSLTYLVPRHDPTTNPVYPTIPIPRGATAIYSAEGTSVVLTQAEDEGLPSSTYKMTLSASAQPWNVCGSTSVTPTSDGPIAFVIDI